MTGFVAVGLSEVPLGAVAGLAFLMVVIVLWVTSSRHWKKRFAELEKLMPSLGYQPIVEPTSEDLLPALLFHPNGFESMQRPAGSAGWKERLPRMPKAWTGELANRAVTVLDVTIDRIQFVAGQRREGTGQVNATVIRCDPAPTGGPPDFLVEERALFKNKVKGQRSINGPAQIGEHYFVFSDAPDTQLEDWISPILREQLGHHRLWTIAAHEGVLYLTRRRYEAPGDVPRFLQEGEGLLTGLLASR